MLVRVNLTSLDHRSEKLDRSPDHAGQVEDEHDEGLQHYEAGKEAALEGEKDDDPGEGLGYGADGDAVGDYPVGGRVVSRGPEGIKILTVLVGDLPWRP